MSKLTGLSPENIITATKLIWLEGTKLKQYPYNATFPSIEAALAPTEAFGVITIE